MSMVSLSAVDCLLSNADHPLGRQIAVQSLVLLEETHGAKLPYRRLLRGIAIAGDVAGFLETPGSRQVCRQHSMARPIARIVLNGLACPGNTLFVAPEREVRRGQTCHPHMEHGVVGTDGE